MSASEDWQETLEERKHRQEQRTIRVLIVSATIALCFFSGLVVHCMENSPPDLQPSHGNPCTVGPSIQPGETISCPDYAKTPTP